MKKILKVSIIKIIIIFAVIGLDLLTKHFFYQTEAVILPGLVGFRKMSQLNTGGAWSILNNLPWLLILITSVVLIAFAIFDFFHKETNIVYSIAFSFILGGALGNLIDRIFLGGVRDFLYFIFMPTFPTFNIADTFIFIGACLLFVYIIFIQRSKKNKEARSNEENNKEQTKNK